MKVLIVGAGIAGLSLAALLKQRGLEPTVIEKSASFGAVGYMLGLYPTGANVLRALNCYDQYLEVSVPGQAYAAYTSDNKLLKQFSFTPMVKQYGPYQLITRYELLYILRQTCGDLNIRFNTEVSSLTQNEHEVEVQFHDKTKARFDLVVGADGLHSQVRSFILSSHEYQYFNTGWGGWVWWSQGKTLPGNTIQEFWGQGTFLGAYPVKGKAGLIAAIDSPTAEKALEGEKSRQEFISQKFAKVFQQHPDFLNDLPPDQEPVFFWSLNDQRATTWHKGRVVLVGDSAAAFLPTAGVGASMALESAAVLNDVLSRTSTEFIPHALSLFEKRRKARVEGAQNDSRKLAKMMFVSSSFATWMRNYFTKVMSVQSLMKSIMKGFDEPI
ncbi:FAD-dependent oxidoreductase [Legionella oakridgensis]|uniref:FAD-dependent oxidoreductase n=1 Tax=Legionella oakridgensis TaxID=29423 RepID=UPI0003DE6B64|nr:NAD(P)/FAD-dependent oxidoreductase [Legionella oakridgensis]ETO93114.1 2-polyprenyl-6-methoxyphenol hydroxylase [Legionella oakridgensis RV-2-2007]